MKLLNFKYLKIVVILFLLTLSCTTEEKIEDVIASENISKIAVIDEIDAEIVHYENQGPHDHNFGEKRFGFTETFENGNKSSYAEGPVNLSSGNWFLNEALIGNSSSDRKFGLKSLRIRNEGFAIMSFNMDNGARSIRIRHAKFGGDGNSTWRLIVSFNNGLDWSFMGGTVTTRSTSLNTTTININESRAVRFGIYKTGGGSNRLNIDNIEIITSDNNGGGEVPQLGLASRDSNLTFGNPSNANNSNANNYFLSRDQYALSYNNGRGTANWVSWHLSSAWLGSGRRCNCFSEDLQLPNTFFKATDKSYRRSGFDRGHICPSGDRTGSNSENSNTFFTTNIAPQAADNNQKSWNDFENYLRSLVGNGNEIHIIAGVAGRGGVGKNGFRNTINSGNITVPDSFWKVALILPNGANDITRVTADTRVIAINVPNDQGISTNWRSFRTSINTIEDLTGYDLLENIPNNIESIIESRIGN
ncbi:DNA/RNA non-specific endonuclease [Aquimarina agarilytica]|uniref:DNA/RNA non-specific endonuclease n=1 Tax=Aquimarina agarilytica TaxID=1087449 RepID=UPI000287B9CE|nr:DNA/RNA non-specific endonuclease [Aquimarina agarilytica]